jgi:hypothetical protein
MATIPVFHTVDIVKTPAGVTLSGGVETDLLNGGTAGFDMSGCDVLRICVQNTGSSNSINTLKIYTAMQGSTNAPAAWSNNWSVAAKSGSINGVKTIEILGFHGGLVRLTANSTSGTTCFADVQASRSDGTIGPLTVMVDGVNLGPTMGGTVSGNLAQSAGTVALTANGASSFTTSSGALTITAAAASTWSTSGGALTVDAAAALNLGPTNATSVAIGAAAVAPSFPGGLTVAAGKAINGGSGALTVDTTGTLSLGTTNATAINMGAASIPVDLLGGLSIPLADAGATGTSGTVNKRAGTFTLTGTTYTLTNSTIATTDLPIVTPITAAPGAYIASAVVTLHTLTVTMSASVTSIKFAFAMVGSG